MSTLLKPRARHHESVRPQAEVSRDTDITAAPSSTSTTQTTTVAGTTSTASVVARYAAAVTRISLGFVFLWAFFDKLFGWGKATPSAKAWINGGSPTKGFLSHATGPFAGTFHSLAGQAWADWLFMGGLLGIGAALTIGIAMRIAAASGVLLLVFMWAASLPLDVNPFMDDHLIYAMALVTLAAIGADDTLGLGRFWKSQPIVSRYPVLK